MVGKGNYYVRDLNLSIREKMLEDLLCIFSSLRSNLNESRRIAAAKKGSRRLLIEQTASKIDDD